MKIGHCILDLPATLGGGFVFRDTVAKAAAALHGRHTVELIKVRPVAQEFVDPDAVVRRHGAGEADDTPLLRLIARNALNPGRLRALAQARLTKFIQNRIDEELAHAPASHRRYVDWAIDQKLTIPNPDKARVFDTDISGKGYDLLWFNNIEPIHVGIPYIFNIFDLQHRFQPWFPEVNTNGQYRLREGSYAEATRRAAFVLVASDECKEQVALFYSVPTDRIRVIPFPTPQSALEASRKVDGPTVSEQELREKYGIRGHYLFYPAQFWPHKNHVNLLRGLSVLRDRHGLNFEMVFTGADHGNADFIKKTAADLGLQDCVHFIGFVPYEEVVALYRFAFALTYVTFFGPDNLPPLEAFAFGCPVVLSNIPGVEKLFDDVPVLVDHRDETSIADGIKRLVDAPQERALRAEKGRAIAQRNTVERYVEKVQELFDEFESVRRCWP